MGLKTLAAAAGGSILYRKFLHHPILTRGAAAPQRTAARRPGDERTDSAAAGR